MESWQAFVFDIDGTLVDSNTLHARAWEQVLLAHGFDVSASRIIGHIGMGGDRLVPALVGEVDPGVADAMRDEAAKEFARLALAERIRVLPGAGELLQRLRARGVRTAVASSGQASNLDVIRQASGFDAHAAVEIVVMGNDVAQTKPSPDLVAATVERLGLSPRQCAIVGDTPYDMEAAVRAGAVAIGLLTGVHDDATLRAAGAKHVFLNALHLADHLEVMLGASAATVETAVRGAVKGATGAVVMTAFMAPVHKAAGWGPTPPRLVTDRLLKRLGHAPGSRAGKLGATAVAHLAYGAAAGALFELLRRAVPAMKARPRAAAMLYAGLIWLGSYGGWIPAAGIMRVHRRVHRGRAASSLAAHVLYGLVLGR